jgi:DNA-binding Lrp family transcriptional regulator
LFSFDGSATASQSAALLPDSPLRVLDNLVSREAARKSALPTPPAWPRHPVTPPCHAGRILLDCIDRLAAVRRRHVVPFFVQIKCHLGKSYEVASKLADAEIASEIYSTAGDFDLLVKFYVEDGTDIGHFVNEKVQTLAGIQDTRTILTFKAFGR